GEAPSCFDRNVGSLWYRFISPVNGILEIETGAAFNDLVTVYQGDCNTMNAVACFNRDEHGFTGETNYLDVNGSTSYMIRISGVDSKFGLMTGDFCLSLDTVSAVPIPPVNDLCNNAITITVDSTDCTIGTNQNANFNGPEPTLNLKTRSDIWYSFVATANVLDIETGADFADVIAVYSGTCGDLTEFAVNEFGQSLHLEDLIIGETYFLQIGGFFATIEGDLCLEVKTANTQGPNNDLCANAATVNVGGTCVVGTTSFADFDGPSPSCEIFPTSNIWFEFTAPASGGVQLNTGSTVPHVVSVYSGTCNNFEEILCMENPLYCSGYFPLIELEPGENYFLQVAAAENGFGYLLGDICLSIEDISTVVFEPLQVIVEAECISSGISVLNVMPFGGQGAYVVEGNITGDTLVTGTDYFTVVSDAEGCELALTGIVECGNLPCTLGASLAVTGTSCYNGNDGTAEVDISGGGTFDILWSDNSTEAVQENLSPGVYLVTVANSSGCSQVFNAAIPNPEQIIANATATSETGMSFNDGTATVNPTGGVPPYTYEWSNGETTASVDNLEPGVYSVVIFDANNCSNIANVNVGSFDCLLAADITAENITCAGSNNGTLNAEITNGTDVTYLWSNAATTPNLENLPAGTYTVTIIDGSACQDIATATITEPEPTEGMIESFTDTDCFGDATGQAFLNVTGGTAPYTYDWPGGGTGAVQTTLLAGDYEVTFTDANGCSGSIPVVIAGPIEPLESSIAATTDVLCSGASSGSATAFAQGGTAGYTYQWDDPDAQSSATADNLSAGTYTVTITDNNNCTSTAQAVIGSPPTLSVSVVNVVGELDGASNGSISIEPMGGTAPYTFSWVLNGDVFSEEQNITDLEAATSYNVLITDANGCMFFSPAISVPGISATSEIVAGGAVSISPNPTTGRFVIAVELDGVKEVGVEVFDALGQRVYVNPIEEVEASNYEVDLEDYPAGVYIVRVQLGDKVFVGGVVVE
ncbi:MAG: T9SS type A sorting domain-containing protein, partial [Saprospiraceae bacterium]